MREPREEAGPLGAIDRSLNPMAVKANGQSAQDANGAYSIR